MHLVGLGELSFRFGDGLGLGLGLGSGQDHNQVKAWLGRTELVWHC